MFEFEFEFGRHIHIGIDKGHLPDSSLSVLEGP